MMEYLYMLAIFWKEVGVGGRVVGKFVDIMGGRPASDMVVY